MCECIVVVSYTWWKHLEEISRRWAPRSTQELHCNIRAPRYLWWLAVRAERASARHQTASSACPKCVLRLLILKSKEENFSRLSTFLHVPNFKCIGTTYFVVQWIMLCHELNLLFTCSCSGKKFSAVINNVTCRYKAEANGEQSLQSQLKLQVSLYCSLELRIYCM